MVDDDDDTRNRLEQLLADEFSVLCTDRCDELLQHADCDLVLMDVRLPMFSGDMRTTLL